MAKKSFSRGLDTLFENTRESSEKASKSVKNVQVANGTRSRAPTKPEPTPEPEARSTLVLAARLLEEVKALAYYDRTTLKEVMTDALDKYLKGRGASTVTKAVNLYRDQR